MHARVAAPSRQAPAGPRHDFGRIALLAPAGVQARRTTQQAGDACERQADEVAEQVLRGTAPLRPVPALAAPSAAAPEELAPRGAGRPLAPAVRTFMESRLGHDFSRVRIHTDVGAAQAARAIDARAYATGRDIVFAPGQFAPETVSGRGLLAHELTHVVQQSRGAGVAVQRKGFWGAIGGFFNSFFHIAVDYSDKAIRKYLRVLEDSGEIEGDPDSDDMARQIVDKGQHRALSVKIRTLLVAEMLDGWTLGGDERAIIEILRSATQADRNQIVAKIGRAQIWDKFSGKNRHVVEALTLTAADLQDAARMARLDALSESELQDYRPNVVDAAVRDAIERLLSRKRHELGSYPEQDRRGISQGDHFDASAAANITSDLEAARLLQNKAPAVNQSTTTGTTSYSNKETVEVADLPLPPGLAIEFETRIGKANRPGLDRIARHLLSEGNLPPNLTRNLAIQEMGKVYRFTRFNQAGGAGVAEVVLIEEVGLLAPTTEVQATGWDTRRPRPGAMAVGRTQIRAVEIRRDKDWMEVEWRLVTEALTGFPDSVLKELVGVNFKREPCQIEFIKDGVCLPADQRPRDVPAEAGRRSGGSVQSQTITLYDDAFATSPTRYGLSTLLVSVLAHEVGHQADLGPLDVAYDAYAAGGAGSRAVLDQARSLSGVGWKEEDGKLDYSTAPSGGDTAFMKAAARDGLVLTQESVSAGAVSKSSQRNVREYFAETFAMYLTDPRLLKAIRPHVYDYLAQRFPR